MRKTRQFTIWDGKDLILYKYQSELYTLVVEQYIAFLLGAVDLHSAEQSLNLKNVDMITRLVMTIFPLHVSERKHFR
jgi:hypothetical protein